MQGDCRNFASFNPAGAPADLPSRNLQYDASAHDYARRAVRRRVKRRPDEWSKTMAHHRFTLIRSPDGVTMSMVR